MELAVKFCFLLDKEMTVLCGSMLNEQEGVWLERSMIMGQILLRREAADVWQVLGSQRRGAPSGHC